MPIESTHAKRSQWAGNYRSNTGGVGHLGLEPPHGLGELLAKPDHQSFHDRAFYGISQQETETG